MDLLAHCEHLRQQLTYAIDALEGLPTTGWNTDSARDVLGEFDPSTDHSRGAVLTPEQAAVAATLVDLMKRSLPPHINEAQQVDAYLALKRLGGQ